MAGSDVETSRLPSAHRRCQQNRVSILTAVLMNSAAIAVVDLWSPVRLVRANRQRVRGAPASGRQALLAYWRVTPGSLVGLALGRDSSRNVEGVMPTKRLNSVLKFDFVENPDSSITSVIGALVSTSNSCACRTRKTSKRAFRTSLSTIIAARRHRRVLIQRITRQRQSLVVCETMARPASSCTTKKRCGCRAAHRHSLCLRLRLSAMWSGRPMRPASRCSSMQRRRLANASR